MALAFTAPRGHPFYLLIGPLPVRCLLFNLFGATCPLFYCTSRLVPAHHCLLVTTRLLPVGHFTFLAQPVFTLYHWVAAVISFQFGCRVSTCIAPLCWRSYIIFISSCWVSTCFTPLGWRSCIILFCGCRVSICIAPLGWCSYIILIRLPGQHFYCTTGLVQLYYLISGCWVSACFFAPLGWCC